MEPSPAPSTPEGEVVSWADRIAYVCHDLEDAVAAGVVTLLDAAGGRRRAVRYDAVVAAAGFIGALVRAAHGVGSAMPADHAEALAALRSFNYERIYLRPASTQQAASVVKVLRALVELYVDRPNTLPLDDGVALDGVPAGSPEAVREAVAYVAGMTDRFAFRQAATHLGWKEPWPIA